MWKQGYVFSQWHIFFNILKNALKLQIYYSVVAIIWPPKFDIIMVKLKVFQSKKKQHLQVSTICKLDPFLKGATSTVALQNLRLLPIKAQN